MVIDLDEKFSSFNDSVNKWGKDFQAAWPVAEEIGRAFEEFEDKGLFLFDLGKNQKRILIQTHQGVVAEYDSGPAVGLDMDLIADEKGIVRLNRLPEGLAMTLDPHRSLNRYDFAYPSSSARLTGR
jgi:hypothetical protein